MSFKSVFGLCSVFCLLLTINCFLLSVYCFSETIDRIVAVVNEKVITLTDLRIVETFGLYDEEIGERAENPRLLILEKLIGQKLIIQLASEEVSIEKKEVDSFQKKIVENIGLKEAERKLGEFGLEWDDLRGYLQERILYQKIISEKFSQGIIVSLEEIEKYYNESYLPSRKRSGMEPQPMIEILDEIESIIRQDKTKIQVDDWIKNLKKKAEIQVKL